jgi:hypothetical protein
LAFKASMILSIIKLMIRIEIRMKNTLVGFI